MKLRINIFTVTIGILLCNLAAISQISKTDSLIQTLNSLKESISKKADVYNDLAKQYVKNNPANALSYADSAISLSEKLSYKEGLSLAWHIKGMTKYFQGNYPIANEYYTKALVVRQETGDKEGVSATMNNIGAVYCATGDYDKAIENYLLSVRIKEELNDSQGVSDLFSNIGVIYYRQMEPEKALQYYFESLNIREKLDDKPGIATCLSNIGNIYADRQEHAKALESFSKSLKISEETGDKHSTADYLSNIGTVYMNQKDYERANNYNFRSLGIKEKLYDKEGMVISHINIGNSFSELGKLDSAIAHLTLGLKIAEEIEAKSLIKECYKNISEVYSKMHEYSLAYRYEKLYGAIKDSVYNETKSKQIAEIQTKYETEKKEQKITILNKDNELQQTQLNRQQIILWFIVVGLLLTGISAFVSYRSFNQKKKANILLEAKNNMIEKQRNDILASINYAKNIQKSMLLREEEVQRILPFENFIFFRPKDIVSGDFYWFSKQDDKFLIAAVDCTGHGVPGGFMSMIGNSLLNEVVIKMKITKPSDILSALNILIRDTLRQTTDDSHAQDGMDMAICSIDIKNRILEYAGARNPLYIISSTLVFSETGQIKFFPIENSMNKGLYMIKGDMFSIGGKNPSYLQGKEKTYTNHEFPFTPDTNIYIFSDGYIDQQGGMERKKLGSPRFRDILLKIWDKNSMQQKEKLAGEISDWQGIHKQIDDMLVIGIKFKT